MFDYNFFHYNNGITFLCESIAPPDPLARTFSVENPQIVNGGQTIRVLNKAFKEGKLKDDVVVLVRVISSEGNKDFANNVAVNLNNQTKVDPSFLKSNDPRIIQLYNSILSLGWYLERREGEVEQLSESEKESLESTIGFPLDDRVIHLKEGAQAYAATYLGLLELAKKNPQKIFQDFQDGGLFDDIFNEEISAKKFVDSYRILVAIDNFIGEFTRIKRKKSRLADWRKSYSEVLSTELIDLYGDIFDQIIPQSSLFLCGLIYWKHVMLECKPIEELIEKLESQNQIPINTIRDLLIFSKEHPEKISKPWPSLLRTQSFFEEVKEYMTSKKGL